MPLHGKGESSRNWPSRRKWRARNGGPCLAGPGGRFLSGALICIGGDGSMLSARVGQVCHGLVDGLDPLAEAAGLDLCPTRAGRRRPLSRTLGAGPCPCPPSWSARPRRGRCCPAASKIMLSTRVGSTETWRASLDPDSGNATVDIHAEAQERAALLAHPTPAISVVGHDVELGPFACRAFGINGGVVGRRCSGADLGGRLALSLDVGRRAWSVVILAFRGGRSSGLFGRVIPDGPPSIRAAAGLGYRGGTPIARHGALQSSW